MDDPGGKVDVVPAEPAQLAAPQPGVERGRVDRPQLVGERGKKLGCLLRRRGPVTLPDSVRQPEPTSGVLADLVVVEGVPEHDPHRDQHVPHLRSRQRPAEQPLDQRLQVAAADVAKPHSAKLG